MSVEALAAFESAVLAQAPPGAVVVGASISPDGQYGVALTFLPAANYLMDDLFRRSGDHWELSGGGSGGGISWTSYGEDDHGVLRFADEAPKGASAALVQYEGQEYRVPVRQGYFVFVAWHTPFAEDPTLIEFT